METAVDQTYRYATPSTVVEAGGRTEVALSTSGGRTPTGSVEHPRFFDGTLAHAEQAATALLVVARVARTRFHTPPGMLAAVLRAADPVVTSDGQRLRFESFSACCGVHARFDVLPAGLDHPPLGTGTTNVDVNPPLRAALARVSGSAPLHLQVGHDVTVTTEEATVTEEKVPLPPRWLKGFAEVQLAAAQLVPLLEVDAAQARRFLRSLPNTTGRRTAPLWVVQAGAGLRLTSRAVPGAVSLAGPERLKVLDPLLRFASRLRVHGPAGSASTGASVWQLDLVEARVSVTLSPDSSRGFSGEGGALWDLADDTAAEDAGLVSALLSHEPRIDLDQLAANAGLDHERVRRALTHLAAVGRVGYDNAEAGYFHRELPYDPATLMAGHPRLTDARALVDAGAVLHDGDVTHVLSNDTLHLVRRTGSGYSCTCPWYAKHRDTRGPCKHVLAADLVQRAQGS